MADAPGAAAREPCVRFRLPATVAESRDRDCRSESCRAPSYSLPAISSLALAPTLSETSRTHSSSRRSGSMPACRRSGAVTGRAWSRRPSTMTCLCSPTDSSGSRSARSRVSDLWSAPRPRRAAIAAAGAAPVTRSATTLSMEARSGGPSRARCPGCGGHSAGLRRAWAWPRERPRGAPPAPWRSAPGARGGRRGCT